MPQNIFVNAYYRLFVLTWSRSCIAIIHKSMKRLSSIVSEIQIQEVDLQYRSLWKKYLFLTKVCSKKCNNLKTIRNSALIFEIFLFEIFLNFLIVLKKFGPCWVGVEWPIIEYFKNWIAFHFRKTIYLLAHLV